MRAIVKIALALDFIFMIERTIRKRIACQFIHSFIHSINQSILKII